MNAVAPHSDTTAEKAGRIIAAAVRLIDGLNTAAAEDFIVAELGRADDPDLAAELACALGKSDLYGSPLTMRLLEEALAARPNDVRTLNAHTFTAWIRAQYDPTDRRALNSARRYLTVAPDDINAFRLLILTALGCREPQEAFLAATAAATAAGRDIFVGHRRLSRILMQGMTRVGFNNRGKPLSFELATFSAQAIEGSSYLVCGQLTETEDLEYCLDFVGACDVIVEIGSLLGNHTVFFMKHLSPRRICVFDADPNSCALTRTNVGLNQEADRPVTVDVVNAFIGKRTGEAVPFAGATATTLSLTPDATPTPDFIKIDVDGGEMDVLEGAEALIVSARPKVMIEVNALTEAAATEWFVRRGFVKRREIDHAGYKNLFFSWGGA